MGYYYLFINKLIIINNTPALRASKERACALFRAGAVVVWNSLFPKGLRKASRREGGRRARLFLAVLVTLMYARSAL